MPVSLIVPVAKMTKENSFSYLFGFDKNGVMLCVKAMLGLELSQFSNIYFVILKIHDTVFNVRTLLELQIKQHALKNAKVVVLDKPTESQPETIYRTIKQECIQGKIFIKDADGYFKCGYISGNGVAIQSLEDYRLPINLQNKSFVHVDDNFYVTNIIENKIIGKYLNVGGYFFEDAQLFCEYCDTISLQKGLHLSHIVYAMLLDKLFFRPIEITDFNDWETDSIYNKGNIL